MSGPLEPPGEHVGERLLAPELPRDPDHGGGAEGQGVGGGGPRAEHEPVGGLVAEEGPPLPEQLGSGDRQLRRGGGRVGGRRHQPVGHQPAGHLDEAQPRHLLPRHPQAVVQVPPPTGQVQPGARRLLDDLEARAHHERRVTGERGHEEPGGVLAERAGEVRRPGSRDRHLQVRTTRLDELDQAGPGSQRLDRAPDQPGDLLALRRARHHRQVEAQVGGADQVPDGVLVGAGVAAQHEGEDRAEHLTDSGADRHSGPGVRAAPVHKGQGPVAQLQRSDLLGDVAPPSVTAHVR
ncbi:hypothetical protein [uncultured Pseudokineococcus sp.]|uniref:hypothetical protein n=1 Tax=uncultured Pseudokineococcus sp. TaxID=1642928 RepID=UPI002605886E|nr:hypothetical protein [uncultured Pseudokineococcus sp.]